MASARTAHQSPLDPDEQALFLAEAHDQIEAFRMAVAALAAGDVESVHPAFRAIHTLKGSAAAAGYEDLVHAAHSTEAALERLRAARAVPGRALADSLREAGLRLAGLTNAVADAHDIVPERLQHHGQRAADAFFVINDQNAHETWLDWG